MKSSKESGIKFSKRFNGCPTDKWADMVHWCEYTFASKKTRRRTWEHYYPTFYFRDEQHYAMFLLKWT